MRKIIKCTGEKCPVKLSCNRFMSKDNKLFQEYYVEVPGKIIDGEFKCEKYLEYKPDIEH